ncbi:MAG: tRNA (adenosine(37)-N6)-dimethylallyltransferase MiaA [Bacillota bacterium]|jgi:tRNA dimethylallyltransferase
MLPMIIIAGPTAVGKTALAIWLAQQLNTEIISADSMQVYQAMDIGTAKPTPTEQLKVAHHLIDLVKPDQPFSVADYQEKFVKTVADLNIRHKIPLVVGGTGLYLRACLQGYALDNSAAAHPELRAELAARAATHGNSDLYQQLTQVDPIAATQIHPNDLRRIIRALEVYLTTGVPISRLATKDAARFQTVYLWLNRHRAELYRRIETRVDRMLEAGLVEEVIKLRKEGYAAACKPMQSLGYKQINQYLDGQVSLAEATRTIKQKTRNYAKRQLTWFKREPYDRELNLSGKDREFYPEILRYIEGRLSKLSNL